MAGHSKWKNIQHRKGAQDAKRGKIFTKIIKEISVAVKTGGGTDPEANPRLRTAILASKSANMPKDTVDRAIKKASGVGGQEYMETTFEGYGPDGVAIFIECATDNNTRTVANIRSYFNKHNGSLGKDGCLQFIFERKGIFVLDNSNVDEDELTLELIDVGAEEVELEDGHIIVTSLMENFGFLQDKIGDLGISLVESGLQRIPTTTKEIEEKHFQTFLKLIDLLEDDDDVQKVYHNVEYNEEYLNSSHER